MYLRLNTERAAAGTNSNFPSAVLGISSGVVLHWSMIKIAGLEFANPPPNGKPYGPVFLA
jgi:hypothetical protein